MAYTEKEKFDLFKSLMEGVVKDAQAQVNQSAGCVAAPQGVSPENALVYFTPELRKLWASIDEDDVKKLRTLLRVNIKTLEWLEGKTDKELKQLEKAMDFFSTSSSALKVLLIVFSASATMLGVAVAAAKNGYDVFAWFRGH